MRTSAPAACPPASTLTAFASGALDGGHAEVEAHLASCPDCCAALAASTSAPEAGQVLAGRYRVLRELGRGAHGEVYLCEDLRLGRQVALKWLAPGDADPASALRLLHEARILAALEHPHLSRVYDAEVFEGRPFLVSALATGGSLAAKLSQGPLDWREACERFAEAASGLHAAHQAGVVHCDVKPANLLLDGTGRTLVADFGLATWAASEPSTLSLTQAFANRHATGRIVGTPAYLAPEVAEGCAPTPRSDQCSLGLSLQQALTGQVPAPPAALLALLPEAPRPAAAMPSGVPRAVLDCLARMTAPLPATRYRDLGEVERALRAALDAPRARRRRLALLGVGVMTALVVVGAGAARARTRCAGAEDAWAKGRLGERLGALAKTLPEAPRAIFERRADALAQSWRDVWRTSCEAEPRTGPERWSQVQGCLEAVAAGISTAAELASVRAAQEPSLAFATLDEATPETCTKPPSQQPEWARARQFTVEREALYKLNAFRTVSDFSAGIAEATALRERAKASGQPGLEAVAAYSLGYLHGMGTDVAAAQRALLDSELLAERAGDDRLRARALAMHAFIDASMLSKLDAAEAALDRADAIVAHTSPGEQEGEVVYARATLRSRQGRLAESADLFRAASELAHSKGNHEWIQARRGEARAVLHLKRCREAERLFDEALEAARNHWGDDHPVTTMLWNDLGTALLDAGHFVRAREALGRSNQKTAASLANVITSDMHLARIEYLLSPGPEPVRAHEQQLERSLARTVVTTLQANVARRLVDEYRELGRAPEGAVLGQALIVKDLARLGDGHRELALDRCLLARAHAALWRPEAVWAVTFDALESFPTKNTDRACLVLEHAKALGMVAPGPWLEVLQLERDDETWEGRLRVADALARLGRHDEALAAVDGIEGARAEAMRAWLRGD